MAVRKNEYSTLAIKVKGYRYNEKSDKEVSHHFDITGYSSKLKKYLGTIKGLENSLVEIPLAAKRYRYIGLNDYRVSKVGNHECIQLSLGCIYRDQEEIQLIDKTNPKKHKFETIQIGGDKFRFIYLHCTIFPGLNVVVSDHKLYNNALSFYLENLFANILSPTDYMLTSLDHCVRVSISGVAKENYQEVLENKFKQINEIGMVIGKPSMIAREGVKSVDLKKLEKEALLPFQEMIGKLFGHSLEKTIFDSLPFKSMKISFTFDNKFEGNNLGKFKKNLSERAVEYVDNIFVSDSSVKYKDDETQELTRAVLHGVTETEPCNLEEEDYSKDEKMWDEQKRAFTVMRSRSKR